MGENMTVEQLETEHFETLKKYMQSIYVLWNEFGLSDEKKVERAGVIWKHFKKLMQSMFDEETSLCMHLKDLIKNHLQDIENLSLALSVQPKEDFGSGLFEVEKTAGREVKRLKELKHARLKKYQGLRGVESVYCRLLDVDKLALSSFTGIPSENNLMEIEKHIQKLSKLQTERQKKFCLVRKELSTILEETELSPETPFEREILNCETVSSLSDETLKSLDKVICKAHQKKAELEEQQKLLLAKLSSLWEELNVPHSERSIFLSNHVDHKVSTIKSLQNEVDVYQKIKEDKFRQRYKVLRDELKTLWDKCYITDSVKKCFPMYYVKEISKEVLDAHEKEINKWKKYCEEVGNILAKVEKRQTLWDMLMVFEDKATNPNRFQNRGGNLLQEEKDRKKLQRELPALEDSIFKDIDLYESKSGKPFLFYGEDYRNYITRQWQDRNIKKDDEKLERIRRHSREMDNEFLLATPTKRPTLQTPNSAPCKSVKTNRELVGNCSPISCRAKALPSSFKKLTLTPKNQISPVLNKGICTKLFPDSSSSSSANLDEKQDVLKELNLQPVTLSCTTYSEFACELDSSERYDLQSSLLPNLNKKKKSGDSLKKKRRSLTKSQPNLTKSSKNSLSPVRGALGRPFLI